MAVAFLALPLSALSGQPGMTRRHFGVLAGSTLAASPIATSAALPYQSQPGFKLNTGAMFPTASFGLQVRIVGMVGLSPCRIRRTVLTICRSTTTIRHKSSQL